MSVSNVLFSKESDEWSTPDVLFDSLNKIFHFTLDAAASDLNHKLEKYYSIKDSGLLHSWKGETVFCNPPYSRVKDWAKKCCDSFMSNANTIVLLVPARTDIFWFHEYVLGYAELVFLRGRLKFSGKGCAPFPSMLAIYHSGLFVDNRARYGGVV